MKYFNGFSLQGEEVLFQKYIVDTQFTVVGFSYGAIKAFEYALETPKRVDKVILLSPAFFQTKKRSFIQAQLKYFQLDRERYIAKFLKMVAYPSNIELSPYLNIGTLEDLKTLLNYSWKRDKILELQAKGVEMEIFLGGRDKIIDVKGALNLFTQLTTTYFFKEFGHILNGESISRR